MRVRPAITDDSESMSRIARATFSLACPADTPAEELERYISENLTARCFQTALDTSSQEVRVLENAGDIVGFSLVDYKSDRLNIPLADGIPELTRCYVDSKHHGTGAAQLLLTATLAGISGRIRLTVNDQNARAIGFYQRNGFLTVGETSFQCGDDVHRDLVMVRGL
ncbi:GNAT family N-acetyltransferase [Pseudomonas tolaasii]|uniref:GNAT family N-acetyltransferase n=1 Tax=Pseudomonas tolaasii TaxID=29442 RepID=UPI001C52ACB5|nr:GNAT family N-acetyltransferase [Pseudomonas tolaasii]QXQ21438.1 GNAT family N-acetyltransferase [Pseudomonas tolaasii]